MWHLPLIRASVYICRNVEAVDHLFKLQASSFKNFSVGNLHKTDSREKQQLKRQESSTSNAFKTSMKMSCILCWTCYQLCLWRVARSLYNICNKQTKSTSASVPRSMSRCS